MIHLICGPIGAGKTTLAHQLATQHGAVRFSEDEWLSQLFVPDAPEGLMEQSTEAIAGWAVSKYPRCRGQIWLLCQQLLPLGIPVVLDGAAANKAQRDLIRQKAVDNNVGFQLHYIDADADTRRTRVMARNVEQGKTWSLDVTPGMFEMMESFFEPPIGDELESAQIIRS